MTKEHTEHTKAKEHSISHPEDAVKLHESSVTTSDNTSTKKTIEKKKFSLKLPKFSLPKFNFFKKKTKVTLEKETLVEAKHQPKAPTIIENTHPEVKRTPLQKVLRFIGILFVILIPTGLILGALPYGIIVSANVVQPFFKAANFTIDGNAGAVGSMKKKANLLKDGNNLTSILIVGIDTRAYGSKLLNTDTIILASYNNTSNKIAMVSFPRDLNVNYPNTPSIGKINATYAYGEIKKAGGGMDYLRTLIQNLSGTPIHYYVMVDLKGFTTVIDQLGGVDVNVDTAFTGDYPNELNRWTTIKFAQGMQHMDGARALQYARIRHAYPGSEASDFARARRQQKIIQAVVDKATKSETLQNPKTILEIMGTVASNIKFNRITPEDINAGIDILVDKGKPDMYSLILDPSAGGRYGRLITRGSGYLYTLEPSAGRNNWSQVKSFLSEYMQEPLLAASRPTVCIYNAGKPDYKKTVSSLASHFYYTTFKDCGGMEGRDKSYVYNVGGKVYASTAQYIAKVYGYTYVDATDPSVNAPRPKDIPIVIALK